MICLCSDLQFLWYDFYFSPAEFRKNDELLLVPLLQTAIHFHYIYVIHIGLGENRGLACNMQYLSGYIIL
jgi:hypothetical protein